MKLTVYCITRYNGINGLLVVAKNSIPFTFVGSYADVKESVISNFFFEVKLKPLVKELCKDTGKTCILNLNHTEEFIRDLVTIIIGNDVTWKSYSFNDWDKFILGCEEYSLLHHKSIEIDHPIRFSDPVLEDIIAQGLVERNKSIENIQSTIKILRKKGKKNGH